MSEKVISDAVSVKNWDDWFENCNAVQTNMQSYEDLMNQYYDKQYSKTEDGRMAAAKAYRGRHKTGFFTKHGTLPKWKRNQCILNMLKCTGIVGVLCGVLFGLVSRIIAWGDGTLYDVFCASAAKISMPIWGDILLRSVLIGLLVGTLCGWVPAIVHVMCIKRLCKKMAALETKLKPRVRYLPPKYRNSIAVGVFYELYCNYGVITFGQAVSACDDFLISNQSVGATMAILFDEPYENTSLDTTKDAGDSPRGLYVDGKENTVDDPNLPNDIRDKTFQGTDNADKKLAEMVGLTNVKSQVSQMKNRMEFYGKSSSERISGNHMCFLGPPGTGKTTVARIITRILYDFGYIKENKCVEIDGGYLKSPYVGQTTERATAIIRYSLGGVLFIDEAYLLYDEKGGAAAEALGVLMKAMEDYKNDFVVILAGYEDNVNRLLSSNEGFSSRIKYKIYFEDFTEEEMTKIFRLLLKTCTTSGTYQIEKDAMELLTAHFAKERKVPGFGNARVVRNALDVILDNHADHFMKKEIPADKKFVIVKKDIDAYLAVREKQMQEDGRNFIASQRLDSTVVSLSELKGRTKNGSSDPDKDLAALVGLENVKQEIAQMKAQFAFYDGKIESEGHHMCFVGPPGTGKTTVAAIMTAYLYQMGIIQENRYLDINGDFLRGMYLGHTGKRTEAVVQYAQGMVLFVDEAYLLQSDGGSDNFGQEAIGVLLDAMEKYRKSFVVIFAGYEKEMNMFLGMNSGLESRITQTFHFESYKPKALCQIMQRLAKNSGFTVESDVWIPLQQYLKVKRQDPRFGNARFIRSFFEDCKKSHILNYSKGSYGEDKKFVITLEDVNPLFESNVVSDAEDEYL